MIYMGKRLEQTILATLAIGAPIAVGVIEGLLRCNDINQGTLTCSITDKAVATTYGIFGGIYELVRKPNSEDIKDENEIYSHRGLRVLTTSVYLAGASYLIQKASELGTTAVIKTFIPEYSLM